MRSNTGFISKLSWPDNKYLGSASRLSPFWSHTDRQERNLRLSSATSAISSPLSMESLVGPSAVATSSASSPFPIMSPKAPSSRRLRISPIASKGREEEPGRCPEQETSIVPVFRNHGSLSRLSKDDAMGLVLSAATGSGWTTGSGMEGPAVPASDQDASQVSTFPWSLFTKSPRRRMRVAFTCNVCGQRTTRAINPHAYTDGTVFVQCCGCNIFHKLVDNLNLFHEMKCYVGPSFRYKGDAPFNYWGDDDDDGSDNMFPLL